MSSEIEQRLAERLALLTEEMDRQAQQIEAMAQQIEAMEQPDGLSSEPNDSSRERALRAEQRNSIWFGYVNEQEAKWYRKKMEEAKHMQVGARSGSPIDPSSLSKMPDIDRPLCVDCEHAFLGDWQTSRDSNLEVYCAQMYAAIRIQKAPKTACMLQKKHGDNPNNSDLKDHRRQTHDVDDLPLTQSYTGWLARPDVPKP